MQGSGGSCGDKTWTASCSVKLMSIVPKLNERIRISVGAAILKGRHAGVNSHGPDFTKATVHSASIGYWQELPELSAWSSVTYFIFTFIEVIRSYKRVKYSYTTEYKEHPLTIRFPHLKVHQGNHFNLFSCFILDLPYLLIPTIPWFFTLSNDCTIHWFFLVYSQSYATITTM